MPVLEGLLARATRGPAGLLALLEQAAAATPDGELVFYSEGLPEAPSKFTYSSLLENALVSNIRPHAPFFGAPREGFLTRACSPMQSRSCGHNLYPRAM